MALSEQGQAQEVFFFPTSLAFNDAPECSEGKSVRSMVKGECDPAPIGMGIAAVTASLSSEHKTVRFQCGVQLTRGQRSNP